MKSNQNISVGVTFGLLTGLVYCILLFLRWQSATNFIQFGILALVNYLVIIGILFYEASYRRKLNGGYIETRAMMQTLFISVLIFEFFYSVFNFIYLKYIDPGVIDSMKEAMRHMLDKAGDQLGDEQRKEAMERFDELGEATQVVQVIKSYFISIAVSGIIALIVSAIMKKRKPVFQEIS